MSSGLEKLREFTTVVADTGEFDLIKEYAPQDSTTNPSLIYQAAQKAEYRHLFDGAVDAFVGRSDLTREEKVSEIVDHLFVLFGLEIIKLVPGRVSIECDPRLSFHVEETKRKALKFVNAFEKHGIGRDRIYIKLSTTWEGLTVGKELQELGIECNMTLIFSRVQAIAAATYAKANIVSPFVGRVTDWHVANSGTTFESENDPGVEMVRDVHNYYKAYGLKTRVMACSFRSLGHFLGLAGLDLMTIPPKLLTTLRDYDGPLERRLTPQPSAKPPAVDVPDEATFRWLLNADACGTEKLADGIRKFSCDQEKLCQLVRNALDTRSGP